MGRRSAARRERVRLVVGLTAAALVLVLLPSGVTAPARVLFNEAAGPLETGAFQRAGEAAAAGGTLVEMFRGRDRERALAAEVVRLQNERERLLREAARCRADLAATGAVSAISGGFRVIRAPVGSYDTAGMRRSITVRAGSRAGVGRGMAVTASGGLVGLVQETGPWQCRVRLITDPGSALACRTAGEEPIRAGRACVLVGTGGGTCRAEWLDAKAFVDPGEMLFLTGFSAPEGPALVPEDVPAARVVRVEWDAMRPLFRKVEAVPVAADLERLEFVEILVPEVLAEE